MLFAIVSETLITGSLKRLPNDPTVQQAVRDLAKDHAIDEGLHHAFFRSVFIRTWRRLPVELRRRLGPLLPRMILAFLESDVEAMSRMLERFPDVFDDPSRIASEVAGSKQIHAITQEAALPAIRVLTQGGAFEESETGAAFRACGLAVPCVTSDT